MRDLGGHIPVLKQEVLEFFAPAFPGRFLDMTFGGGGHTRALLQAHPQNSVVAIDCDPEATARAEALAKEFPGRFAFAAGFFDEVKLESAFAGALFDLGVSSFQLDAPHRGFSFRADAEADMRMNPAVGVPAWRYIEEANNETLCMVVRDYAEERNWRAIVRDLEAARGTPELRTTLGLAKIISNHARGRHNLHPATRVFMGLRMAVNREIERLASALPRAFEALREGGVLAVISFHSVEDRVVKTFFKSVTRPKETARATTLLKHVGRPAFAERRENARSRSAKLRVLQKGAPASVKGKNL